jgi:hypothetical protein
MGAGASATASNVQQNALTQYDALLPERATALSLSQVLLFKPVAGASVQLRYLPTLFLMDSDMDGFFGREEVVSIFELCSRMLTTVGRSQLCAHMQGYALLHLQRFLKNEGATESFCKWFVSLFLDGQQGTLHQSQTEFVSRDVAHGIHHVLQLDSCNGYDSQGFLDLLQRMGEEDQLMDIGREDLDDVIPVSVVNCFAKHYAASISKNMEALNAEQSPQPP